MDDGFHGSLPWSNSNEMNQSQGFSSVVLSQGQSMSEDFPSSNNFSTGQPLFQNSIELYNHANHFSGEVLSQIPSESLSCPNINPENFYPQPPLANPGEVFGLKNSLKQNPSTQDSFSGGIDEFSLSLRDGINSCFMAKENSQRTSINPMEEHPNTCRLKGKNPVGMMQPMEIRGSSKSKPIPDQPKGKLSLSPSSVTSDGSNNRIRRKPYDRAPPTKGSNHLIEIMEGTRKLFESPSWRKNGNFSDCLPFSHGPSWFSRSTSASSYDSLSTTSQKWQSNPERSSKGKGICSYFSCQDDRNFHTSPNILSESKLGTQTSCQESMNHGAPDENSKVERQINLMIEFASKRLLRQLEERQMLSAALQPLASLNLGNKIPSQIPSSSYTGRFNNPMSHGISSFYRHGTKDLGLANQFPSQNPISSFLEGRKYPVGNSSFHQRGTQDLDLANQFPNQNSISSFLEGRKNPIGNSSFHHHGTNDLYLANRFLNQNPISSFPEGCNNPIDKSSFHHDGTKTNQDISETSNWIISSNTSLPLDSVNSFANEPNNTRLPFESVKSIANETPMTTDAEVHLAKEIDELKNSGQEMETETDYVPCFEDQREDFDLVSWAEHQFMGDQLDDFDLWP